MIEYKFALSEYPNDLQTICRNELKLDDDFLFIAGPCCIESEQQIEEIAKYVKKTNANVLRGGAFKPRTSPYSFQGLGKEGLEWLSIISKEFNIPVITEILDVRDIEIVAKHVDILQVGARNMQNFPLLKELGKLSKPILLKRGLSATIEEWLGSAEYIFCGGNRNVILCERGIRTFSDYTRNTLDLSVVPIIKNLCKIPIIVDPSHGTGVSNIIENMCLSAIMAGCDGIMIEVHNNPQIALSDKDQALTFEQLSSLDRSVSDLLVYKRRRKENFENRNYRGN